MFPWCEWREAQIAYVRAWIRRRHVLVIAAAATLLHVIVYGIANRIPWRPPSPAALSPVPTSAHVLLNMHRLTLLLWMMSTSALGQSHDLAPERGWVTGRSVPVRASPDPKATIIGHLERGAEVRLLGCMPSCSEPTGFALVVPIGAVPLSSLALDSPPPYAREDIGFEYGKVLPGGALVYAEPSTQSRRLTVRTEGQVLALRPERPANEGWLQWKDGGYIEAGRLLLFKPESFRGEPSPSLPLAFFLRDSVAVDAGGVRTSFERHAREPIATWNSSREVELSTGRVPRAAVRIAWPAVRPKSVPASVKWVRIDLTEQTLVAYEGDKPVFTTLVSTGKTAFETREGVFRAWLKVRHVGMHGRREPYDVEEVPSVMFFNGSEAIHGQCWHSNLGRPVSHGCVNLSLEDAAWLFDWAPPPLPSGWHSLLPGPAAIDTLYVVVERSKKAPRKGKVANFCPSGVRSC
jgi:hypothetical protein